MKLVLDEGDEEKLVYRKLKYFQLKFGITHSDIMKWISSGLVRTVKVSDSKSSHRLFRVEDIENCLRLEATGP